MSDLISKGALFSALCNAQDKSEIFAIINNFPTVQEVQDQKRREEYDLPDLTIHEAAAIFDNIDTCTLDLSYKAAAILDVLDLETHNGFTKAAMLRVIRWLFNEAFNLEVDECCGECCQHCHKEGAKE